MFEKIGAYERGASAAQVKALWDSAIARRLERRAQIKSGICHPPEAKNGPDGMTIRRALEKWLASREQEVRSEFAAFEVDKLQKARVVHPATGEMVTLGDVRIRFLDRRLVEAIRVAVVSKKKRNGSSMSPWTSRHTLSVLKQFVTWLRKTGEIPETVNPVEFLELPKKPKPDPGKDARTAEEIAKILKAASPRIAAIAELMLLGGGRRLTEVCDLREDMIEWERGYVNWWDNKTNTSVCIPLHPPLSDLLKRLIQEKDVRWRRAMRRTGRTIPRPEQVVLMRNHIRGYASKDDRKAITRAFARLSNELGMHVTTRFARKSVATYLAEKGLSDNQIIALTGHADAEMLAHYRARKEAEPGVNALTEFHKEIQQAGKTA
ncbi:MAG: site-specific integrase [Candidatus Polarisedimenticolia bacterium]